VSPKPRRARSRAPSLTQPVLASEPGRVSLIRDGAINAFACSGNLVLSVTARPPICYKRSNRRAIRKETSSMTRSARALMALPLAALVLSGVALMPAWADEFTGAQRAEIVTIVRDALKKDPTILRDAVLALQSDDGERDKVANRAAVASARDALVTPNDPVGGNPRGSVTIVEFFDVRCPYCRKLEPEMAAFLASDHDVRLVYKDLPILGPASVIGTKALLAARKQNAYEKLREAVMRMPPDITKTAIEAEAKKLGLDAPRLLRDMDDASIQEQIEANLRLAHLLNIQGTPAMVIGNELLPGAVDAADLKEAVNEARTAKK
jgi:protein-disulfide isomerase